MNNHPPLDSEKPREDGLRYLRSAERGTKLSQIQGCAHGCPQRSLRLCGFGTQLGIASLSTMNSNVTIIGGGLAGCEAARVLSAAAIPVRLVEMRPVVQTAAHHTDDLAEIVCSNSLGSTALHTGKGVLLSEMESLGSLVVAAARQSAVPAGMSLALDRGRFGRCMTAAVSELPGVELIREECVTVPEQGPVIVASGPLTSDALGESIAALTGRDRLAFFDAIAPIVSADSLDMDVIYAASRYGRGDPDFLNCPLSKEQYEAFVDALLAGEKVPTKEFEKTTWFEGCMPVEVMAERGRQTLAFGPMRPVGLEDPRTGLRAHGVVQLRREDKHGQLYNLVGFQTKLKYGEQKRVFSMIPGLANAEFVRLGSVHRNTFISSPALLAADLSLKSRPDVWFAGQITGVEGYAESAAVGIMAGLSVACRLTGRTFEPPPPTSMLGGALAYLRDADAEHFQPMNVNFGLLPPLEEKVKNKRLRRDALSLRAREQLVAWIEEQGFADWLSPRVLAEALD
ncbi:MAG: methylenetetrahydrofolate--tRNA-(uracil-5-)-methyltransferase [Pseudohongiellaceae bacterium]|jgi:methylenetetrahydrofolate--tRNA-(uracil-5-)-methyltransferase